MTTPMGHVRVAKAIADEFSAAAKALRGGAAGCVRAEAESALRLHAKRMVTQFLAGQPPHPNTPRTRRRTLPRELARLAVAYGMPPEALLAALVECGFGHNGAWPTDGSTRRPKPALDMVR